MHETSAALDEAAASWVARLDRAPLSEAEAQAFADWLAGDARRRGALLRAQACWHYLDRGRALGGGEQVDTALDAAPASLPRRQFLLAGAGAATIAVAAVGLLRFRPASSQAIATATGEIRRVPFADGSFVAVNTDSSLRVRMERTRREVELARGEAWFDVAKDAHRPFTVASGDVRVRAVGTAFSVRRQEGGAEVRVTEGKVQVWSIGAEAQPELLVAGQSALVTQAGLVESITSSGPSDRSLAWRDGQIVFEGETLSVAVQEFNRYNVRRLEVDPVFGDQQIVGWFRTNDLEGFAQAASAMVGGEAIAGADSIRIVPRNGTIPVPAQKNDTEAVRNSRSNPS